MTVGNRLRSVIRVHSRVHIRLIDNGFRRLSRHPPLPSSSLTRRPALVRAVVLHAIVLPAEPSPAPRLRANVVLLSCVDSRVSRQMSGRGERLSALTGVPARRPLE